MSEKVLHCEEAGIVAKMIRKTFRPAIEGLVVEACLFRWDDGPGDQSIADCRSLSDEHGRLAVLIRGIALVFIDISLTFAAMLWHPDKS